MSGGLTYTGTMRRWVTLVLLLAVTALFAVPVASADPCNGNGGNPNNPHCQDAPEAPSVLLFPLAAILVVGGYVLLTRRRRAADL
jgi:hypothetical protein